MGSANSVAVGDTVRGVKNVDSDDDYFALDVAAGTRLDIDVDAQSIGSRVGSYIRLLAPDGVTILVWSNYGDIFTPDGTNDPHIRYRATTGGRYYIYLETWTEGYPNATGDSYRLKITLFQPLRGGPGDPGTTVAAGGTSHLVYARKLVAGSSGDFFTVDRDGNGFGRVVHVRADGSISDVMSGENADPQGGLAVDVAGNLLVGACDRPNGSGGVVWRITPSGEKTRFYSSDFSPGPIAIGADGDVWVWLAKDPGDPQAMIVRLDAAGNPKDTLPGVAERKYQDVIDMAFSPQGDLHVAWREGIYKYVGGAAARVADAGGYLAFDKDGYVYVSPEFEGIVRLLNPQYQAVKDTFALVGSHFLNEHVGGIAFARSNGTTTAALVVTHSSEDESATRWTFVGDLVRLNPNGVRAAGWPVGQQGGGPVTVSVADITNALMGGTALTAAQVQYLDTQGNHNGVLDVGDLRAYLRARGQLAGSKRQ